MNLRLKAALIECVGSQMTTAKALKVSPTYLSASSHASTHGSSRPGKTTGPFFNIALSKQEIIDESGTRLG